MFYGVGEEPGGGLIEPSFVSHYKSVKIITHVY